MSNSEMSTQRGLLTLPTTILLVLVIVLGTGLIILHSELGVERELVNVLSARTQAQSGLISDLYTRLLEESSPATNVPTQEKPCGLERQPTPSPYQPLVVREY
jgi:hypothetical protein